LLWILPNLNDRKSLGKVSIVDDRLVSIGERQLLFSGLERLRGLRLNDRRRKKRRMKMGMGIGSLGLARMSLKVWWGRGKGMRE